MAATNYTPIQLYYSTTATAVPLAANLAQGELAINITDGKLYYEDNAGVVQVIATKGAGTIGGSTTQIQYNNAGALAGSSAMVFNNSTNVVTLTTLNLTNALGATYGGTAQSTYAQGDILYASAANTLSKLTIGAADYILTSSGTVPQWSAPTAITVATATNLAGGLAGSVPYQSAAATTTFLGIGAANRVMTSTGTAPQWVTSLTGLTGVSSSSITNTSLTVNRVVVSGTGGLQVDDADLTFDGTTLSAGGFSTVGLSSLVKTVKIGDSSFNGVAVFAAATPAKLYLGTGTVTDTTSAIGATNAVGAVASLDITPIAATNTSVTYTNAATLYIAGAPSAGTNVTITNPYSLYVAAGDAYFGGTVTAGTVNLTTLDLTNLEVTNIKAKDGTASITLADSTGVASFTANPVLSGGTANGVLYLNGSKSATSGSALTFDGANLGVAITPNSWTTYKVVQVGWGALGSYNAADTAVFSNAYFEGGGWKYIGNGFASQYRQLSGVHSWQTAQNNGSGAGAAIAFNTGMSLSASAELYLDNGTGGGRLTFVPNAAQNQILSTTTLFGAYNPLRHYASQYQWFNAASSQMMTLTADTNLLVGATSPFNVASDVGLFAKSQAGISRVIIDNQNIAGTSSFEMSSYGGGWSLQVPGSSTFQNALNFKFGNNQRVRFASSGAVGFGTQGTTGDRLIDASFQGATLDSGSNQFGLVLNPTYGTNVTATIFNLYTGPNLTAGTTVNNVYNLYLEAINSTGSTVNVGKWGLYQAGSADSNYFAGPTTLNNAVTTYSTFQNGNAVNYPEYTQNFSVGTTQWIRLCGLGNPGTMKIRYFLGSGNSEEFGEVTINATYTAAQEQITVTRQSYNSHLQEVRLVSSAGAPNVVYFLIRSDSLAPRIAWTAFDVRSNNGLTIYNDTTTPGAATASLVLETGSGTDSKIIATNGLFGAYGGGVQFPGTANLSSNVNTLDDYEEGTFDVVLQNNAGTQTVTFAGAGKYTKVGRFISYQVNVYNSSVSAITATEPLRFVSLPFNVGYYAANSFIGSYPSVPVSIVDGSGTVAPLYVPSNAVDYTFWTRNQWGGAGTLTMRGQFMAME